MNLFEINAAPRNLQGKGASRRLRREGKVPAVVYGAGKEPANIEVQHHELIRQTEQEAFYSHILTLKLAGRQERVVLKDMQRHPYKPQILHLDLQRIDEHQELTMRVPLHFINESQCVGVKQGGGVVSHLMSDLEIICLPKDLPEYIAIDIGAMDLGDTIHLADLSMPEGVAIAALQHGGDDSQPVVSVHLPRIAVDEEAGAALDEAGPAAGAVADADKTQDDDAS